MKQQKRKLGSVLEYLLLGDKSSIWWHLEI